MTGPRASDGDRPASGGQSCTRPRVATVVAYFERLSGLAESTPSRAHHLMKGLTSIGASRTCVSSASAS